MNIDPKSETDELKPDFEALSNGFGAKDNAIEDHLYPLLQKDSLEHLSFKHAVDNGTISGGLRMALHKMLTSYSQSYNQSLLEQLDLNEKIIRKSTEKVIELTKINEGLVKALEQTRELIYFKDEEIEGGWLVKPDQIDFGTVLTTIDRAIQTPEP